MFSVVVQNVAATPAGPEDTTSVVGFSGTVFASAEHLM